MREILYNKQEGKMNEEVASRMSEEIQDMNGLECVNEEGVAEKDNRNNRGMGDQMGLEEKGVKEAGSEEQKMMEDLVRKLEVLCGEMAVVKGYIVALQLPMIDRCNTWVDGRTVQKVLHINSSTLKAMRENGTMPYSQLGKHLYYNVEDLDGLLRKHYVKGSKTGGGYE